MIQLQEKEVVSKQVGGDHYQMPIQPIEFIVANGLGYREGNVVKYVSRHQTKSGAEDIRKAIHYLEMILEDYNEPQEQTMDPSEECEDLFDCSEWVKAYENYGKAVDYRNPEVYLPDEEGSQGSRGTLDLE